MRTVTPQIAVHKRSLALLDEVVDDQRTLTEIAQYLGIPPCTAYRQVAKLVAEGYLVRLASVQYAVGHRLLGIVDEKRVVANAAGPALSFSSARLLTRW